MNALLTVFFSVFLLLRAFDAHAQVDDTPKTIFDAITTSDLKLAKDIIAKQRNVYNARNAANETPFQYALLHYRNAGILKPLLEHEKNLNKPIGPNKTMPLFLLISRYADVDLIDIAIKNGAKADIYDEKGIGTLVYAYHYFQDAPVIGLLINGGADIHQKDENKYNILHLAIRDNKYGIADLMIRAGVSPDLVLPDGRVPLQLAFEKESPSIVSLLIKRGANLYPTHLHGTTLLMEALKKVKTPQIISLLINAGLDVQDRDENGKTPLMYAVENTTTPEIVDILLKNGAYPRTKDDAGQDAYDYLKKNKASDVVIKEIKTLLDSQAYSPDFYELLRYGTAPEIEKSIDNGADVNKPDYNGLHPVLLAAQYAKDPEVLKHLLRAGAKLDATDENGRSALIYAAATENVLLLKALFDAGADVNAADINGDTVLMYVVQRSQNLELLSLILKQNVDINARNSIGKTALITAVEFTGEPKIIFAMLDKGADITIKDDFSKTAVEYAKENIRLRAHKKFELLIARLTNNK